MLATTSSSSSFGVRVEFRRLAWRCCSTSPRHCHWQYRSCWRSAECRVCWAGMSFQMDISCTSHRSVTAYSWSCTADEDLLGKCSPLCWSSFVQCTESIPILYIHFQVSVVLWCRKISHHPYVFVRTSSKDQLLDTEKEICKDVIDTISTPQMLRYTVVAVTVTIWIVS